mmetsp:Transcript_27320/g.31521  ORF Transcript_27320/g.31521 Transcript_27320/m.31521 type:complete len:194 (+) Transcript_27320:33-614(+)
MGKPTQRGNGGQKGQKPAQSQPAELPPIKWKKTEGVDRMKFEWYLALVDPANGVILSSIVSLLLTAPIVVGMSYLNQDNAFNFLFIWALNIVIDLFSWEKNWKKIKSRRMDDVSRDLINSVAFGILLAGSWYYGIWEMDDMFVMVGHILIGTFLLFLTGASSKMGRNLAIAWRLDAMERLQDYEDTEEDKKTK